jgi:hypothetical protein
MTITDQGNDQPVVQDAEKAAGMATCQSDGQAAGMATGRAAEKAAAEDADQKPYAIRLRWRVADGKIPLLQRHYRSLASMGLAPPLLAWVRSRLEWACDNLIAGDADAVLCLDIDPARDVVVSLDTLRPAPLLTLHDIVERQGVGGAPELKAVLNGEGVDGALFFEADGALHAAASALTTASATLVADIAHTLGFGLTVAPASLERLRGADAAFLASDEFGHLPIVLNGGSGPDAPINARIADALGKAYPQGQP